MMMIDIENADKLLSKGYKLIEGTARKLPDRTLTPVRFEKRGFRTIVGLIETPEGEQMALVEENDGCVKNLTTMRPEEV